MRVKPLQEAFPTQPFFCPPDASQLLPGSAAQVAANIRIPEPGTTFEATVKLCTQDDVEGQCVSETVTFTFEE